MTLFPAVIDELLTRARRRRHRRLRRRHHPARGHRRAEGAGVREIFTPGASTDDIVNWVRTHAAPARLTRRAAEAPHVGHGTPSRSSSSDPVRPVPPRPSPCTGAIRRWRANVLILEKARHPRPKVCAGGLIPRRPPVDARARHPAATCRTSPCTAAQVVDPDAHRRPRRRQPLLRDPPQRARRRASPTRRASAASRSAKSEPVQVAGARRRRDPRRRPTRHLRTRRSSSAPTAPAAWCGARLLDGGRDAHRARASWPTCRSTAPAGTASRSGATTSTSASCAAACAATSGPFPCLIDGVPHANIGVYAVTPSGSRARRAR